MFTIPPLKVNVGGKVAQTQPVTLKVEKAGGGSGGGSSAGNGSAVASLEVVIPKTKAYVGEMLPMELRLTGDGRVRWGPESMPDIPGEGFTKTKLGAPREQHTPERDSYVFRTAIAASKAGRITIGPIEIPYIAQVPRARPQRRQRSMFDLFDDSIFGDQLFAVNQRFKATAPAIELEVKPLPVTGRPENFSGAVGDFKFTAEGAPKRVKIGDPVTMTLEVTGRGNFDRMEAPTLLDTAGWRSYPPSGNFKADDDLGMSGTKTFSMALIPETKKTAMPRYEFVYFDPEREKFVTLKSAPTPLAVEGSAPPSPPPIASAEPAKSDAAPAATPAAKPNDIHGIRYDDDSAARRSFRPIYVRREFLLAQLAPLVALAAFLFTKLHRTNLEARRAAELRREKAALLARLRGARLGDAEFFETAARAIQLDTALVTGRAAGTVDAALVRESHRLDPETADAVERIFSSRAELLYAGAGGSGAALSADERKRLIAAVETLEKCHARS